MTTCFFCQNLLSDFVEGILPASRHEEIRKHLGDCPECAEKQKALTMTLDKLKSYALPALPEGWADSLADSAERGRRPLFSRDRMTYWAPWVVAPVLVLASLSVLFPRVFPWISYLRQAEADSQFTRYFPLLQGASEIVEEQASWLQIKDPSLGSLWEEGGVSPEEFEKTFSP